MVALYPFLFFFSLLICTECERKRCEFESDLEGSMMQPSAPPSKKRGPQSSGTNYWSIFSQEQADMFESPRAGSAKTTPTRSLEREKLLHDSSIQSNKDYVINEFTSLLLPSPLRSERHGQITFHKERNTNRDIATNSFKSSSPNRSRVGGRLQPPIRSSIKKTPPSLQQPLLL